MAGKRVSTILGLVTGVELKESQLTVNVSCLAAGSNFRREELDSSILKVDDLEIEEF
jgi:hypothetical protein